MVPPPDPEHIFQCHSLVFPVTCLEIIDYHADKLKGAPIETIACGPGGLVLAAGYQTGDCVVWDLEAKLQILKIHNDVAAGVGDVGHGILAIGGCEDMLWIHVRNYGLKLYRWVSAKELQLEAELHVDHYGFCGAVSMRCNIAGCGIRYLFGVPCPSDANSPSDVSAATVYTLVCAMDATSASNVSENSNFCDKSAISNEKVFRIYSKCSFNRNHNAKETKFGMPMKMLLVPVAKKILLLVSYESGHLISWRLSNRAGDISEVMEVLDVCRPEPVIAFGLDMIRGIGVAVGGDAKIKFLNCKYLKRNEGTEIIEDLPADELDLLECSQILAIDENKFLPLSDSVQSISSLAVRFDGKIGACGLKNGSIVVFSLKSPRLLAVLQFHTSPIVQVTFVPRIMNDKRLLLAACRGGKISLWSIF